MELDNLQKQMSMTNKKEKIFNVRKVHYKQFDHEKYLKPSFSPFHIRQNVQQVESSKINRKGGEYNYQVAIISSPAYKQLTGKYNALKQQHSQQKQERLEELRLKEEELNKYKQEKQRIDAERIKIIQRRDELREKIEQIREKNEILKVQKMRRYEEYRIMNMEYLRNMVIGMRYQNGMDIDLDNMSYEELLQLQQKIGSVSKGLTEDQIQKLPKKIIKENQTEQLCSICYCNAKQNQEFTVLPCKHCFHTQCIKQWLMKQKVCPMCKQQIIMKIQSSKNLIVQNGEKSEQQIKERSIQSIFKSKQILQALSNKSQQQIENNESQDSQDNLSNQQILIENGF